LRIERNRERQANQPPAQDNHIGLFHGHSLVIFAADCERAIGMGA
jgi:hypothetical protein